MTKKRQSKNKRVLRVITACFLAGGLIILFFQVPKFLEKKRCRKTLAAAEKSMGKGEYFEAEPYLKAYETLTKNKKAFKQSSHYFNPAHRKIRTQIENTEEFLNLVQQPPEWILEAIERELGFFKKGTFNQQSIAEAKKQLEHDRSIAFYKIYKNKLYFKFNEYPMTRGLRILAAVYRILQLTDLPDMEFACSSEDAFYADDCGFPVFTFSKLETSSYSICIPDHQMLAGYENFNRYIEKTSKKFSWQKKQPSAFWRGGTTGGDFSKELWQDFPRSKLVLLSKKIPDQLQAHFSSLSQGAEHNPEILSDPSLVKGFISVEHSLNYKYLIDADGNASGYSRYFWILKSNCVPIKHDSPFIQWYYAATQPYIHYIPCKRDFSDLTETIRWLKTHDDKAKKIAEASSLFATEELTFEKTHLYFYLLLKRYATLFESDPLNKR